MWPNPSKMFSALRDVKRALVDMWLFLARRRLAVMLCDAGALFLAVYLNLLAVHDLFGHGGAQCQFPPDGGGFRIGGAGDLLAGAGLPGLLAPGERGGVRAFGLALRPGGLLFGLADKMIPGFVVPRTTLAILVVCGLLFVSVLRVSWRVCIQPTCPPGPRPRRTLIAGAGEAGAALARELLRHDGEMAPVGFVDDDPRKERMEIAGLPVWGPWGT